jgi:hypothetical protein
MLVAVETVITASSTKAGAAKSRALFQGQPGPRSP